MAKAKSNPFRPLHIDVPEIKPIVTRTQLVNAMAEAISGERNILAAADAALRNNAKVFPLPERFGAKQ